MTNQSDRARAKHQEFVDAHMRLMEKRDQLLDQLLRAEGRVAKSKKAIARSQKRINKLAVAMHNAGPTASPVPSLVFAVNKKPATTQVFNDELLGA